MTSFALTVGSALIAFGPLLALFSTIVYNKAQLVIVVTSAAFFFLMSTVIASFFWRIFDWIGLRGPLAGIIPGVLAQFAFRCWFVSIYHRVEKAIQNSLEQQEVEDQQQQQARTDNAQRDNVNVDNNNVPSRRGGARDHEPPVTAAASSSSDNNTTRNKWTEIAKLRLELNDASCGIAAGVGFGGMHAVLFYGTLLASEMTNNVGVLYQDSCPSMPSLAVSAIYAFLFSVLDIFFMLFTFFGMRRRRMYHRGERPPTDHINGNNNNNGQAGGKLGNTREGGNMALVSVLVAHAVASVMTTADYFKNGCMVSLPATGVIVLFVAYWFWAGVGRIYMPPPSQDNHNSAGGEVDRYAPRRD